MRRSFFSCLIGSFIIGIAVFSSPFERVLFIAAGVFGVLFLWRRSPWFPSLCAVLVLLGALRTQAMVVVPIGFMAGPVQVTGEVWESIQSQSGQVSVSLARVRVSERWQAGKILIRGPGLEGIQPGQTVTVRCGLARFGVEDNFPRLRAKNIRLQCRPAELLRIDDQPHGWRSHLARWQAGMMEAIGRDFRAPQSSLLAGILFGSQPDMPPRLKAEFQRTGTTHIVALSGYNVTIIITLVLAWCVRVVGRRSAWLPALILVFLFVLMTGASPSVLRAAVMATVVHFGLWLGRPIDMVRLLGYALFLMLWFNPLLIFHDLGFQLSFLATLGLVTISERLQVALRWLPEHLGIRANAAATLAAMIATEPLLIGTFGRLSLVAPVTNVLVLPLVPLSMAWGAVYVLARQIWMPLARPLIPLTESLLSVILGIIHRASAVPFASVATTVTIATVLSISFTMIGIYFYASPWCRPRND